MKPETLERVRGVARGVLEKAKESLERTGGVEPLILVCSSGCVEVIQFPGELAEVMNDGALKTAVFRAVRELAHERRAYCVVIATEAWMGVQTPDGAAFPPEEFQRLSSESGFDTLVDLGLVERHEVIFVNAQTPEGSLSLAVPFLRNHDTQTVTYGAEDEKTFGPEEFSGRQKMFG